MNIKNIIKVLFLASLVFSLWSQAYAYEYSSAMDKAIQSMLREDYESALEECRALQAKRDRRITAESLSLEGACLFKLGEYVKAREAYRKAISYVDSGLAADIYLGIGDSYFMLEEYDNALSVYEQLASKRSTQDYSAMLYFRIGRCYQKKSEWTKAEDYFGKLKQKYPDSFEVQLVKDLGVGGNYFTIQVGCFANSQNARKLHDDLKAKGYPVYLTEFSSRGQTLYRVRVGQFVSLMATQYTENKLRTEENLPTHVFP